MATTDFAKTRVYLYMSKLWQEHDILSSKQRELENSALKLKSEIRSLERKWWHLLTAKEVRNSLAKLKIRLKSITRKLSLVVERCTAITKATDSWTGVFYA